jgi:hypothetical protein
MTQKTTLKSTQIKLFLCVVVLVSFLVRAVPIKAVVPDGASSILLRAWDNCKQMGGIVRPPWEYRAVITDLRDSVISGQHVIRPNCWCGLKPIYGFDFTNCRQYINYQLLGLLLTLSILVVVFYYSKKKTYNKSLPNR